MPPRLKLITFDVTGTLLVLREPVGLQYAKVGARYGVTASPDDLTKHFFSVFKKKVHEHPNFGLKGIGWKEWWRQLVHQVFQDSLPQQREIQSSKLDQISSDLIEVFKTKQCWDLAKGAKDLLDGIKMKNVRLGVISNYDPRLEEILKDLNIWNYFSFVLNSYEAECSKPNPEIFKIVENKNQDCNKNEILHIGDDPKLDYFAAKNVGWNALLIAKSTNNLDYDESSIDKSWVVNNITDVYQELENKKLLP